ncbi:hypothetical protein NDA16_002462 [Ustilago loliicola]|nr:hypothetical protein NDA16_002462 [Ustilago loliicola]
MMSFTRTAIASSSRSILSSTSRSSIPRAARALSTTAALRNAAAPVDAKISGIVDQIEKLTLLEAADLVSHLKTRLNIIEIAIPAAGAAAPTAAAPADGAEHAAAEEAAKPKEKTVFTLKLAGLKDPTAKAKVIREVKAVNTTMNLVEAKKFVESTPQVLKEGLNKEDAEKLKAAIEAAGGVVELE